ncbi:MAG: DinB family protein [bacterium]|nr:DinB family protein [bacterium]
MPALYPARALTAMKKNATILQAILHGVDQARATATRDGADGWNVLEIVCHLNDFEQIFFDRNRSMVEQDSPALRVYDVPGLAVENRYADQQFDQVWASWLQRRRAHLDFLAALPPEGWERVGLHPTWNAITVLDMATVVALHDGDHAEQIVRVLGLSPAVLA